MPYLAKKVVLPRSASVEIGHDLGCHPRHVRYVACRERQGSEDLLNAILAKVKNHNKRSTKKAA